ncbi:VOC family protein [Lichenibacterium ramalinae]|uniref:VOC family protein n=1 Tax=Lichenibacterium ramalinae TaxID=2316527 RepID=A0A4Q2R7U2_9HYPH|nr:VOC family protein [Lichenibacterium ramalinae]RYB02802.1 VOC family protein [Lichenibacterium ramalinae]
MKIESLDHLVLTVADIERACIFYEAVLGMEHVEADGRHALHFGTQKINLHQKDHTFEPKARHPAPGSADLCFLTAVPMPDVLTHLARCDVPLVEGPVGRSGATGPLLSVYVRDHDENLIEISNLVR